MKKVIALLMMSFTISAACACTPAEKLFRKSPADPVDVMPIKISTAEYWKVRSQYQDSEVIEEHRSADGTMLKGSYVPLLALRRDDQRIAEKALYTRFYLPIDELERTGALIQEPIQGEVSAIYTNTDRGLRINKGSRDGIREGYYFVVKKRREAQIPITTLLLMYKHSERLSKQAVIKDLGRVTAVNEDSCEAETLGFRDHLGVRGGDQVQFGFDDAPRYAALKRLPEAIDYVQGHRGLGPEDAKKWLIDYLAYNARRSAVPFLIKTVEDDNADARELAHAALQKLSNVTVEFKPNADASNRALIADEWNKWWEAYKADSSNPWPPIEPGSNSSSSRASDD